MKQVTAIIIGAGCRGKCYAFYSSDHPQDFKVVAVAEPRDLYRSDLKRWYQISDANSFKTWEEAAEREKLADCAIICTPDQLHKGPAVAFAKKGYHILVEKPMAVTYEDCEEIVDTCAENKVWLAVCHILRYSPQARKIKQIIDSGAIGDVMNIQHLEPVGFWHFAHSYVRGNWRNTESSTFSLLAKSCHDLDLINFWMGGKKCTAISSFGSLMHFNQDKKPVGAASRCLDCPVENSCPYSAKKIYIDQVKKGNTGWPAAVIAKVVDIENVTEAVRTGPYGRCVYECDNNVMDNQVVNLQFEGGSTVQFCMVACTQSVCTRKVKVFGTKGELNCDFNDLEVMQYDFLTRRTVTHDPTQDEDWTGNGLIGHGGEWDAMEAFLRAVATNDGSKILTGPAETLQSHYLCFMAEKSRKEGKTIHL